MSLGLLLQNLFDDTLQVWLITQQFAAKTFTAYSAISAVSSYTSINLSYIRGEQSKALST